MTLLRGLRVALRLLWDGYSWHEIAAIAAARERERRKRSLSVVEGER